MAIIGGHRLTYLQVTHPVLVLGAHRRCRRALEACVFGISSNLASSPISALNLLGRSTCDIGERCDIFGHRVYEPRDMLLVNEMGIVQVDRPMGRKQLERNNAVNYGHSAERDPSCQSMRLGTSKEVG